MTRTRSPQPAAVLSACACSTCHGTRVSPSKCACCRRRAKLRRVAPRPQPRSSNLGSAMLSKSSLAIVLLQADLWCGLRGSCDWADVGGGHFSPLALRDAGHFVTPAPRFTRQLWESRATAPKRDFLDQGKLLKAPAGGGSCGYDWDGRVHAPWLFSNAH